MRLLKSFKHCEAAKVRYKISACQIPIYILSKVAYLTFLKLFKDCSPSVFQNFQFQGRKLVKHFPM